MRRAELNDQGVIVGYSRNAENVDVPVVWRVVNGVPSDPFVLPGGEGEAWDLTNNDADGVATIVGSSELQTRHLDGQIGGGWQPHPGEWPR